MNEFDGVREQLIAFCEHVKNLKADNAGNYSAQLEKPQWQLTGANFVTEVTGNVGRFTGRLKLLDSDLVPLDNNKSDLVDLTNKIADNLQFYTKQWGAKHDTEFCAQLGDQLQRTAAAIMAYSRPNSPHP